MNTKFNFSDPNFMREYELARKATKDNLKMLLMCVVNRYGATIRDKGGRTYNLTGKELVVHARDNDGVFHRRVFGLRDFGIKISCPISVEKNLDRLTGEVLHYVMGYQFS